MIRTEKIHEVTQLTIVDGIVSPNVNYRITQLVPRNISKSVFVDPVKRDSNEHVILCFTAGRLLRWTFQNGTRRTPSREFLNRGRSGEANPWVSLHIAQREPFRFVEMQHVAYQFPQFLGFDAIHVWIAI